MRLLPLGLIAMMLMMSCMAGKEETKKELAPVERRISNRGALWPLCNNYLHSAPAHLVADASEHFASVCTSLAKLR